MSAELHSWVPRSLYGHFAHMDRAVENAVRSLPFQYRWVRTRDGDETAALAVAAYDMQQLGEHGRLATPAHRLAAGHLGVLSQSFLRRIDGVVLRTGGHQSEISKIEHFLGGCYQAVLHGSVSSMVDGIDSRTQAGLYGLGHHLHKVLASEQLGVTIQQHQALRTTGYGLLEAAVAHCSEARPDRLLSISKRIGAGCGLMAAHTGEILGKVEDSGVQRAAGHFGAGTRVLAQWANTLRDLQKEYAVKTFATQFVYESGSVDSLEVQDFGRWVAEAAEYELAAGRECLHNDRQRRMYQLMCRLAKRKFVLATRKADGSTRLTADAMNAAAG